MHPDEQRFADHVRSLIAKAEVRRGQSRTDDAARACQHEILRLQAVLALRLGTPASDAELLAACRKRDERATALEMKALLAEVERWGRLILD